MHEMGNPWRHQNSKGISLALYHCKLSFYLRKNFIYLFTYLLLFYKHNIKYLYLLLSINSRNSSNDQVVIQCPLLTQLID